jgi:hypothetical protein
MVSSRKGDETELWCVVPDPEGGLSVTSSGWCRVLHHTHPLLETVFWSSRWVTDAALARNHMRWMTLSAVEMMRQAKNSPGKE